MTDIDRTQPVPEARPENLNGVRPPPITILAPTIPLLPASDPTPNSTGKTITIPGIHARHRSKIKFTGYAPPNPPRTEVKSPVPSVYHLWKHSHHTQPDDKTSSEPSPANTVTNLCFPWTTTHLGLPAWLRTPIRSQPTHVGVDARERDLPATDTALKKSTYRRTTTKGRAQSTRHCKGTRTNADVGLGATKQAQT